MEVLKAIADRCSVREYKAEKITDDELQAIVEAARMAPSGMNARKTRLFVIQSPEVLEKTARAIAAATKAGHAEGVSAERAAAIDVDSYNFFYHAPILLIVTSPADAYNAFADCGCVLENAMIQAAELGIGTCWVNNVRRCQKDAAVRKLLSELGVAEDEIVTGSLAIGYPVHELKGKNQEKGHEVKYI